MPLQEQAASANDDLVRVVGVLFIADAVEPPDGPAIVCNDPVASGGREQASKLHFPPQALRCILIADPLAHGGSVIRSLASQGARAESGTGTGRVAVPTNADTASSRHP